MSSAGGRLRTVEASARTTRRGAGRRKRQIGLARLEANLELSRRVHGDVSPVTQVALALGNVAQPQIVDLAQPQGYPLADQRLQNSALGSAAGFVVAVILIPLWESAADATDRRLTSTPACKS